MVDPVRQRLPEVYVRYAMTTFALMQTSIGTSIALARSVPPFVVQVDRGSESAVSLDAHRLQQEVTKFQEMLRTHDTSADVIEMAEAPVSRIHVSAATAAAMQMLDVTLSADDFAAAMAPRTRFPRYIDVDDEE